MHIDGEQRVVWLARLGATRLGLAPAWLPAQAVALLGFSALALVSVAEHGGVWISPLASLWVGLVLLAALDLSVVVHEAGHALAAIGAGVHVEALVLLPFGGATVREPSRSRHVDRLTALAGPAANLVAGGICALALLGMSGESPLAPWLLLAGTFQVLSGLVNLAPIGRCDGARAFGR